MAQFLFDTKGKTIGIFVPINEWRKFKTNSEKSIKSNSKILYSLKKGIKQVKQIEEGKIKPICLKQLLSSLK
jgi:hypothetical protein